MIGRRSFAAITSAAALMSHSAKTFAQKKYDDGATDAEIRIGNIAPYSGPVSPYGIIAKTIDAYWKSVNDTGGVNGRRIRFISLDDGYSPPKTLDMARQLVEQEKVLCLFQSLGSVDPQEAGRWLAKAQAAGLAEAQFELDQLARSASAPGQPATTA